MVKLHSSFPLVEAPFERVSDFYWLNKLPKVDLISRKPVIKASIATKDFALSAITILVSGNDQRGQLPSLYLCNYQVFINVWKRTSFVIYQSVLLKTVLV